MSIDITKLRLGNFIDVYDKETGEWIMERLDIDMFNLLYLNPDDNNYRLSELNDETLLKLGFVQTDDYKWSLGDLSVLYLMGEYHALLSDEFGYYVFTKYNLKYLHQVQNIYLSKKYKELL